jgi:hypothetical protein
VSFAVPADARRGSGTAVDSAAGLFVGDFYRITYDLGRFGERLDSHRNQECYRLQQRRVAGRSAVEANFAPDDEPFGWARVLQVELGGERTLTVRVSCDSEQGCQMADAVFDSIEIG